MNYSSQQINDSNRVQMINDLLVQVNLLNLDRIFPPDILTNGELYKTKYPVVNYIESLKNTLSTTPVSYISSVNVGTVRDCITSLNPASNFEDAQKMHLQLAGAIGELIQDVRAKIGNSTDLSRKRTLSSKAIEAYQAALTLIDSLDTVRLFRELSVESSYKKVYVKKAKFLIGHLREVLISHPIDAFSIDVIKKLEQYFQNAPLPKDRDGADLILNDLQEFIDALRPPDVETNNAKFDELDYLSRRVQEIKDQLTSLDTIGIQGKAIINELEAISQSVSNNKSIIEREVQSATNANEKLNNFLKEMEASIVEQKVREGRINEYEQRFLTISNTFLEYENQIKNSISSIGEATGKADQINTLLKTAEDAVGLKATEGVSKAFIAQRNKSKEFIWAWLVGALGFLVAAAIGTYLLLEGETGVKGNELWAHVVSRIVVVTILLGGATFCSKQYIRQKSIIEDYAYKVVLSQSIIAFIDQIQSRSQDQVVEYLNKVLTEIHKDPQRPRKVEADGAFKNEAIDAISKIIDKVSPSR